MRMKLANILILTPDAV